MLPAKTSAVPGWLYSQTVGLCRVGVEESAGMLRGESTGVKQMKQNASLHNCTQSAICEEQITMVGCDLLVQDPFAGLGQYE
jgi:hypothetical protein